MPRGSGGGKRSQSWRLDGCYEWALHRQCTQELEADPRIGLTDPARYERLKAEADAAAQRLFEERLAAGEPVEAPNHWVGGNFFSLDVSHPLRERSVKRILISPDDHVKVIRRYID